MLKLKHIISVFFIIITLTSILVFVNIQLTFNKSSSIEIVTSIPVNLINKVLEV